MSSLNRVQIIGRLGSDPEIKTISTGNTVCRLSVATSDRWKDKDGNAQERTEWNRVVIWGKLADISAKYLAKGSLVYVEGRLQTRSWEDSKGEKKYTTEIIASDVLFLSAKEKPAEEWNEPSFDPDSELPF